MGRIAYFGILTTTVLLCGCNLTNKLTASKSKETQPDSRSSKTGRSQEFPTERPVDPTKIHLAYAAWNEQSGNYQEARLTYLKVLEKRPKDLEALLGLARVDLAYGRDEEADQRLKKALKLHPKDKRVHMAIGQVHATRSEWREAMEKMETACRLDPYDKVNTYHLAVVETRAGEIQQALNHFTRAVGQAEAHYNLGVILGEQGNTVEAESHLTKALKLKPELKQAETSLAFLRGNSEAIQPAGFSEQKKSLSLSE